MMTAAGLIRPALHEELNARNGGPKVGGIPLLIRDSSRNHRTFMEPSGRNQWQAVANARAPENGQIKPNRCHWLRPVADRTVWQGGGSTVRVRHRLEIPANWRVLAPGPASALGFGREGSRSRGKLAICRHFLRRCCACPHLSGRPGEHRGNRIGAHRRPARPRLCPRQARPQPARATRPGPPARTARRRPCCG